MKRILSIVFAVSLIVICFFSSIDLLAYGIKGFIPDEYKKYNVSETVGCTDEELNAVTEHMLAYLKGNEENLNDDGFFNERETLHMADVQILFLAGMKIRRICIIVCIIILIVLFVSKTDVLTELSRGMLIGMPAFIGITGIIAALFASDFNRYFVIFHKIFFDNDYWLLDPDDSRLINMVPEGFFMDCIEYIILIFAAMLLILLAASLFRHFYAKKNMAVN